MMYKKYFKKLSKLFIISSTICITFILLYIIPTNYDVVVPATVSSISDVYKFDDIDTSNINTHSVSVLSYDKISVLSYIEARLNPYAILSKHDNYVNTSNTYQIQSGTIQKNVSLNNAVIAGFNAAKLDLDYDFIGNIIHTIFGSTKEFKLGDIIIECMGEKVTLENNVNKILISKVGTFKDNDGNLYLNLNLDEIYNFKVLRNNIEVEVNLHPFLYTAENIKVPTFGINFYNYFLINKQNIIHNYTITDPDSIGPSAGFIQSLFIYEALKNEKLTKNLKIVGTGTIDYDGKVGAIGGVQAKVIAANLSKADIFFVPASNYEEALIMYKKLHTKMLLVKINTLEDAINYLKNLGDKNE